MGYFLSTDTTNDSINTGKRCESKLFCLQIFPPHLFFLCIFVVIFTFCRKSKSGITGLPNRATAHFALHFIPIYANTFAMSLATAVVLEVPSLTLSYIHQNFPESQKSHSELKSQNSIIMTFSLSFFFQ